MSRVVFSLSLFLSAAFAGVCRAEDRNTAGDAAIEKVVTESIAAAQKGDWKKYAELIHPDSLNDYKNMWLPVLTAAAKKGPDQSSDLLPLFAKSDSLKSIIAMKPKEFLANSMAGMASEMGKNGIPSPAQAEAKIIGAVHEGDEKAYVVIRTTRKFNGAAMTQVEVVGVKRSGAEWKVLLPDSIRLMAETIRRSRDNVERAGPVKDRVEPDK